MLRAWKSLDNERVKLSDLAGLDLALGRCIQSCKRSRPGSGADRQLCCGESNVKLIHAEVHAHVMFSMACSSQC